MFSAFLREFREFAVKGNAVDLAVGIIIGGAFGKIVSSLVADIIMPPIGILLGGVDFTSLGITLKEATAPGANDAVRLMYGKFIQTTFDFLIVAFAVFLMVKAINTLKRKKAAEPETPKKTEEEVLLTEIRDILKTSSK